MPLSFEELQRKRMLDSVMQAAFGETLAQKQTHPRGVRQYPEGATGRGGAVIDPEEVEGIGSRLLNVATGAAAGAALAGPVGAIAGAALPAVSGLNRNLDDMIAALDYMPQMAMVAGGARGRSLTKGAKAPFYSGVRKAIEGLKIADDAKVGGKEQVMTWLQRQPHVTKDELKWVDLEGVWKAKQKPTKRDLLEWMGKNEVEVEEVTLGKRDLTKADLDRQQTLSEEIEAIDLLLDSAYHQRSNLDTEIDPILEARIEELHSQRLPLGEELALLQGAGGPQYEQYTLPGGSNYREVLLRWNKNTSNSLSFEEWLKTEGYTKQPFGDLYQDRNRVPFTLRSLQQAYDRIITDTKGDRSFYSNHFDQPNILAHLRLTDRTTPDGKKVLFIEEAQSDWQKAIRSKKKVLADPESTWEAQAAKILKEKGLEQYAPHVPRRLNENDLSFSAPDAPLAENYPELVMKRVLQMAQEEGYDAVGWTTGKQQADRYNKMLYENIDELAYDISDGNLEVFKDGKSVNSFEVPVENLDQYVGRDLAEQLLRATDTGPDRAFVKVANTSIGDRGYSDVYDKQLRHAAEKWGKKFGGKVEQGRIQISDDWSWENVGHNFAEAHVMPIPKSSTPSPSYPLFQTATGAGLSALAQRQLEEERERRRKR